MTKLCTVNLLNLTQIGCESSSIAIQNASAQVYKHIFQALIVYLLCSMMHISLISIFYLENAIWLMLAFHLVLKLSFHFKGDTTTSLNGPCASVCCIIIHLISHLIANMIVL